MWILLRQLTKGPSARRAVIIEIADAMVAILNDAVANQVLSQSFEATRYYVPKKDIKELGSVHVSVVPSTIENELFILSRSIRRQYEYTVDVGIQRVVTSGKVTNQEFNEAADPLMLLAEEISDLFNTPSLEGYETAKATKITNQPIYDPRHVDEKRVYTTVVSVTYVVVRDR